MTTLEGVGHCPQVEVPGLVAELVHDFVVESAAPVASAG